MTHGGYRGAFLVQFDLMASLQSANLNVIQLYIHIYIFEPQYTYTYACGIPINHSLLAPFTLFPFYHPRYFLLFCILFSSLSLSLGWIYLSSNVLKIRVAKTLVLFFFFLVENLILNFQGRKKISKVWIIFRQGRRYRFVSILIILLLLFEVSSLQFPRYFRAGFREYPMGIGREGWEAWD